MRVLITCPPMYALKDKIEQNFLRYGIDVIFPNIVQTMKESQLIEIIHEFDGWIIGDDPATRCVFEKGSKGKLKAAVKWGVGVDNVDFSACAEFGILVDHTPNMFGNEVADLAIGYLIGLARESYFIDRQVRAGYWPKNRGISLDNKVVGLIGYGDIGRQVAKRIKALGMQLVIYDPQYMQSENAHIKAEKWPDKIENCDFLIFTCSLNKYNHHMMDRKEMEQCKNGVRVINVARGALINESELICSLKNNKVHSVALDVFEIEPLPKDSYLIAHPYSILGSHNASNTVEAVERTNKIAIEKLLKFLGEN
ncbi:phosphoglycerate dehydrogenase [Aliikangiella maris]|uniref:Phosphoglycerate dehydrogenase n=2 Tax=Aliikangiella maris TaxID=3162458 RepID=A0ABV3MMJ2_9GAMM